jgi:uncharacterized membrane protein YkvA (DUF1232 family)
MPALPIFKNMKNRTNSDKTGPDGMEQDERLVRERFWSKLRSSISRIPFAEDAVASYYCATDTSTPTKAKALLLGALAYFVMPVDAVPDFVALLGFTDDAAVLMAAIQTVRVNMRPDHYDRARETLKGLGPSPERGHGGDSRVPG